MKPQCKVLLAALEQGPMTTREISRALGIDRVSARVHELRGLGYQIRTERVEVPTRYGRTIGRKKHRQAVYPVGQNPPPPEARHRPAAPPGPPQIGKHKRRA